MRGRTHGAYPRGPPPSQQNQFIRPYMASGQQEVSFNIFVCLFMVRVPVLWGEYFVEGSECFVEASE